MSSQTYEVSIYFEGGGKTTAGLDEEGRDRLLDSFAEKAERLPAERSGFLALTTPESQHIRIAWSAVTAVTAKTEADDA